MSSFEIKNSRGVLGKLNEELADFEASAFLSSRHAINLMMTGYHLREWVWGEFAKKRVDLHRKWKLSAFRANDEDFLRFIERECRTFSVAQMITNGTKHFNIGHIPTGRHEGAFSSEFSRDFDVSYLWAEVDGKKESAEDLAKELTAYWNDFFETYQVP